MENQDKLWSVKIADNNDLWFNGNFKVFPFILSQEYQNLRNMFRRGEYAGAFYELKDVLELTIKLPVIYVVADLFRNPQEGYENSLALLLGGPLSLGTWIVVADRLSKKQNLSEDYQILLNEIATRYKSTNPKNYQFDITNWRNDRIGHGSYSSSLQEEHKLEVEQILLSLKRYFENTYNAFSRLIWIYESNRGKERIKSLDDLSSIVKIKIKNGKRFISLAPFIEGLNGSLYLFDAYLFNKKRNIGYLDYLTNNKVKKSETLLKAFYRDVMSKSSLRVTQGSCIIQKDTDELNVISKGLDKRLIKPIYLKEILEGWLNTYDKGLFLLEAESGIGKSTFIKMLDPLLAQESGKNHMILSDCTVRAFYFRQGDTITVNELKELLKKALLRLDTGEPFSIKGIEVPHIADRNSIVDFLAYFQEIYNGALDFDYKSKLVIIFDGIDETLGNNFNIFDFLPDESLIKKNIYIILTSRIIRNPNSIIAQSLSTIPFTNRSLIIADDIRNKDLVNKYISSVTKEIERFGDISTLLEASLLQYIPEIIDKTEKISYARLFEYYLKKLEYIYGEKYFKPIRNTLLLLALSDIPIAFKDLVTLAELGEDRYYLQNMLIDIKPFISKYMYNRVAGFTISHQDIKHLILELWSSDIDILAIQLIKSLVSKINEGELLSGSDLIGASIAFKYLPINLPEFWNCYIREDKVLMPILMQLVTQKLTDIYDIYGDKIYFVLLKISDCINNAFLIPKRIVINYGYDIAVKLTAEISYDNNILSKFLGYINKSKLFDDFNFLELNGQLIEEAKIHKVSLETLAILNSYDQDYLLMHNMTSNSKSESKHLVKDEGELLNDFDFIKYLPVSQHSLFSGQRECVLSLLDSLIKYLKLNIVEVLRRDVINSTLSWIYDISQFNNLNCNCDRTYNSFKHGLCNYLKIERSNWSIEKELYPNSLLAPYERDFIAASFKLFDNFVEEAQFVKTEYDAKYSKYYIKDFTIFNTNQLIVQLQLYYHLLKSEFLTEPNVELNPDGVLLYTNTNDVIIQTLGFIPKTYDDLEKCFYSLHGSMIQKPIKIAFYNKDWVSAINYRGLSEHFCGSLLTLFEENKLGHINIDNSFNSYGVNELLDFKLSYDEDVISSGLSLNEGLGIIFYLFFSMYIDVYHCFTNKKFCQTSYIQQDLDIVLDYLDEYNHIPELLRSHIAKMLELYYTYRNEKDYDYVVSEVKSLLFDARLAEDTSLYLEETYIKKNIDDLCQCKVNIADVHNVYYDEIIKEYLDI